MRKRERTGRGEQALGGEGEAAVQGDEEGGGGLEGEDEAQAVLGVVLQVQLQGVLQEPPVAPSQLAQQRQRLHEKGTSLNLHTQFADYGNSTVHYHVCVFSRISAS